MSKRQTIRAARGRLRRFHSFIDRVYEYPAPRWTNDEWIVRPASVRAGAVGPRR